MPNLPSKSRRNQPWRWGILFLLMAFAPVPLAFGEDLPFDSLMYRTPFLPEPKIVESVVGYPELWREALRRPEAEYKCKAAEAIAAAHRAGAPGMNLAFDELIDQLRREDSRPVVHLCLARSLIAVDAKSAADALFDRLADASSEFHEVVEPALAKWKYEKARGLWLSRLEAPNVGRRDVILAAQSLATLREPKALAPLIKLLREYDASPRLELARALGAIAAQGLEDDAERLLRDKAGRDARTNRLAGVALLQSHRSERSLSLLQTALEDAEHAVATAAANSLYTRDAKLLLPSLARCAQHPDPSIRLLAIETAKQNPQASRVELVLTMLTDDHAEVRSNSRAALEAFATDGGFLEPIRRGAMKHLESDRWGTVEQAARLLVHLEHKPAATRLVGHLSHERREVFVMSAWGLRKLGVAATLKPVTEFVDKRWLAIGAKNRKPTPHDAWIDYQLSQLMQFIGEHRHASADPTLRKFFRRGEGDWGEARAAAVWALGRIHEGKPDPTLSREWIRFLNEDSSTIPPEDDRVRRMSAVSLGLVKDRSGIKTLRKYFTDKKPSFSQVNNACGWALEQLEGEKMPPPETIRTTRRNWFLVPLEKD